MNFAKDTVRTCLLGMFLLSPGSPAHATYCGTQGNLLSGQGPYIGGVVVDADSGLPAAGVRLVLSCCDTGVDYDQTLTAGDGEYSFAGETGALGFWISACYNVRLEDACFALVDRVDATPPNCPRLGEEGCFQFANCDDSERYEVNFKVRNHCTQGCSLGYWRHHLRQWPATYSPSDNFDTTFGVDLFDPDITLLQALWRRGGGNNALARQGVAGLLNAAHPDVSYPLSTDQVIALVQAGDAGTLATSNKLGCPLNGTRSGCEHDDDDRPSRPHRGKRRHHRKHDR